MVTHWFFIVALSVFWDGVGVLGVKVAVCHCCCQVTALAHNVCFWYSGINEEAPLQRQRSVTFAFVVALA